MTPGRWVSTFADAAGDPTLVRTWTEKVIAKHVNAPAFSGDLAVVTFQICSGTVDGLNPAIFRGFGLYDVTDPRNPKALALDATDGRTCRRATRPRSVAAATFLSKRTRSQPACQPCTTSRTPAAQ